MKNIIKQLTTHHNIISLILLVLILAMSTLTLLCLCPTSKCNKEQEKEINNTVNNDINKQQLPVTDDEIYNLITNYTTIYQDDSIMKITIVNPYTDKIIEVGNITVDSVTTTSSGLPIQYRVYYVVTDSI